MRGPIPPELASLSNLTSLNLGNFVLATGKNQLSGPIPPELANLSKLEWLILGENQLSGSIPPQLASLSKLERLTLSNNQLSGPIPIEIRDLPNLKRLDLDERNRNSISTPGTFPRRGQKQNKSPTRQKGCLAVLLLGLHLMTLIGLIVQ